MKKHLLLLILVFPTMMFGQAYESASVQTGESIEKPPPPPPPQAKKEKPNLEQIFQQEEPEMQTGGGLEHFFPSPGIVSNGEGTDHLLGVPEGIDIYIEVLNQEGTTSLVKEQDVYDLVEGIFEKGNLKTKAEESNPPLPFFHVLIMVSEVSGRYAVYVGGRLFESVILERFNLASSTKFQAITWERQSLNVFSGSDFQKELNKAIGAITQEFVERYRYFDHLRMQQERQ